MNLTNLLALARGMIPGAKPNVVDDLIIITVLNAGAVDIAAQSACLKANKKFNVVAGQSEYSIVGNISDYLCVDKPGLWWNNGTQWRPVYPKTLKWLDDNYPNWRDAGDGSPLNYSIDSDILTISPPPLTTLANGFWLYYGKKPEPMTQGDHFPFSGTTTEIAQLSIFDFALIYFAAWKLAPIINKMADANLSMQEYLREREEKINLLYQRRDILASNQTAMKGPKIR
jgi:hypothetical protein